MTPEVASKAFDPFFTTKPIGQGTGLGLSMIYGFAKQSDGFVNIESAPGAGTTITLELPRATGPVEEDHVQSGDTPTGRGETVLVVEDDVSVRLLVTEVLRELGYRFIEAVDAARAESILRSDVRIDLLVSDVGLPGPMNGRQLARLAREVRPALRVLLVTGYVQSVVDRARFVADRVDLLTKPFSLDVLGTKIRTLMER